MCQITLPLQWRHNDHDSFSNHQPHGCLLNRLFRRRSKKTWKLLVTGLCVGNSPGPVNSPHKGPVTRKMFPFDDVIMNTRGDPKINHQSGHSRLIRKKFSVKFVEKLTYPFRVLWTILSNLKIHSSVYCELSMAIKTCGKTPLGVFPLDPWWHISRYLQSIPGPVLCILAEDFAHSITV